MEHLLEPNLEATAVDAHADAVEGEGAEAKDNWLVEGNEGVREGENEGKGGYD